MIKTADTYLPPTAPMMNGLALLLWGWQCDFLIYAIPMAIALELSRIVPWKIPVSNIEFNRVSDLSSMIFLVAVVYTFSTRSYHGIYTILSLLPMLLYLLILAQVYSLQGYIRPSALFISLRRIESADPGNYQGIDLSYPYLFVCLVSASAGNHHPFLFYIFVVILISWTLWCLKLKHTNNYLWVFLIMVAIFVGYGGQLGMKHLQSVAESKFVGWFDQFMWRNRDPQRTSTAIGSLGKLKLSDRIMVRVDTHGKKPDRPMLLREATYTNYAYGVWTNYQTTLQLIDPTPDGKQWIIDDRITSPEKITVSFFMDDEIAIVPIPMGLGSITNVTAAQIDHSAYGALSIELNPGWVKYDVLFNEQQIHDALPTDEDLDIPSIYDDELRELTNQLNLENLPAEEKVMSIKRFFAENFEYSLTQTQRYPRGRYLSKFLFENRKGHCEYFATATALLLRAAGIPARYVVGYSVDEYSKLENQYIGRARHAHSWVLAYVNNQWQVIDTTPPVWAPLESENSSALEPLMDMWSWFAYKLATWEEDDTKNSTHMLIWLLLPVLLYYLWRMFIKNKVQNVRKQLQEKQKPVHVAGTDSPFYSLQKILEQDYTPRKPGETLTAWVKQIEKTVHGLALQELLALHYRYRFDPAGLNSREKELLQNMVNKQLAELQ